MASDEPKVCYSFLARLKEGVFGIKEGDLYACSCNAYSLQSTVSALVWELRRFALNLKALIRA